MPRPAPDFAGTLRPEIQNRGQSRQSPLQERFVDGSKLAEAGRRPVLAIRQFIADIGHRTRSPSICLLLAPNNLAPHASPPLLGSYLP
jgi:hypothetical protein